MEEICHSCLCSGRKLKNIADTKYRSIYSQILNEISVYNSEELTRVCWECVAVMRRWSSFKNNTQRAYLQLVQCAQQDISKLSITSLPRLQANETTVLSYSPTPRPGGDDEVKPELADETARADENRFLFEEDGNVNTDHYIKEEIEEHQEPVTFVNDLIVDGEEDDASLEQRQTIKKEAKTKKNKRKKRLLSPEPKLSGSEDRSLPASPLQDEVVGFDGDFDADLVDSALVEGSEELVKTKQTKKLKPKKRKKKKLKSPSEQRSRPPSFTDDKEQIKTEDDLDIEKEFVCEECGEKFQEKKILVRHLKQHRNENGDVKEKTKVVQNGIEEKPRCTECNKLFSSKKTYRYHMNTLHKGQNRFPCPRCGKVYQWKSNLGRHMRTHKAVDLDELYCETCDRRFASVATYRQHLKLSRRHVAEAQFLFACNDCGKRFVNKTRLRDHIDWDHLNKVKFRCQVCNKPFKCHTSLYVHTQNVHNNKERNNLCHVCGKCYQNAAKLRYHVAALHSNSAAYRCSQCGANFGWYSSLYRHLRDVHYNVSSLLPRGGATQQLGRLPLLAVRRQLRLVLQPVQASQGRAL